MPAVHQDKIIRKRFSPESSEGNGLPIERVSAENFRPHDAGREITALRVESARICVACSGEIAFGCSQPQFRRRQQSAALETLVGDRRVAIRIIEQVHVSLPSKAIGGVLASRRYVRPVFSAVAYELETSVAKRQVGAMPGTRHQRGGNQIVLSIVFVIQALPEQSANRLGKHLLVTQTKTGQENI